MEKTREEHLAYRKRHRDVRRARGRADEFYCTDCPEIARDWSQIHDTTGEDPFDYEPRCRSCHSVYDGIVERSVGNSYGSANKDRVATDDTRKTLSAAQTGRKHSDETRRKMSESWHRVNVVDPD